MFDDAATAWRSFSVFSAKSPLVGHSLFGAVQAYGLGPLQYWLLAIPVRLDPAHGLLWGAAIVAIVGVNLALFAAWIAGRLPATLAVATAFLLVFHSQLGVVIDPSWNPWLATIWVVTALTTAWTVATGHLWWWPVNVFAATVATQCHEFAAIPAVSLCLTSIALGLIAVPASARRRRALGPAITGAGVGTFLWCPPVLEQLTGHPGNLTLIWRESRANGGSLGWNTALKALGAVVKPNAIWLHQVPHGHPVQNFLYVGATVSGPAYWGLLALLLLLAISVAALLLHKDSLAALAALTLVAAIGTCESVAIFPSSHVLVFTYLGSLVAPIGIAIWFTAIWAGWLLIGAGIGRLKLGTGHAQVARLGAAVVAFFFVIGISTSTIVDGAPSARDAMFPFDGYNALADAVSASMKIERLHLTRPFTLEVAGAERNDVFAVEASVAYALFRQGLQPRMIGDVARYFGPSYRTRPGLPVLRVDLRHAHLSPLAKSPGRVSVVCIPRSPRTHTCGTR
jgi:hypothetical protein